MNYYLGVDAGGTSSRFLLADENGKCVGFAKSGIGNIQHAGEASVQKHWQQAIQSVLNTAHLPIDAIKSAFFGVAGVVSPEDVEGVQRVAHSLSFSSSTNIGVHHDVHIALAGGLRGEAGIALIAGTGSSCYGKNIAHNTLLMGGFGALADDGGSGYWIAVEAFRKAVRMWDGRIESTKLSKAVLNFLNISTPLQFMARVHGKAMQRDEIAAFCPQVIELAVSGDTAAQNILKRGAEELTLLVETCAQKLELGDRFRIAGCGGLLESSDFYLRLVAEALSARLPNARLIRPELPAVAGAVLEAARLSGVQLSSVQKIPE